MPVSRDPVRLEPLAARLRDIVVRIARTPGGAGLVREVGRLEVAFVVYRQTPSAATLDRVRAAEATLERGLVGSLAGLAVELRAWMDALAGTQASAPSPSVEPPRPVTTPVTPPVTITPSTPEVLIIPKVLPSRAALAGVVGRHRVILVYGGSGAVDATGAPSEFNGNPRGPSVEALFSDLASLGARADLVVLDFEYALGWLDRMLPTIAPGGALLAPWSAARGELSSAVLAGARTASEAIERASATLAAAHPQRYFDSPHALFVAASGRLLRGRSAIEYALLDPSTANSTLARSNAAIEWVDARRIGSERAIRECEQRSGLREFVARARALLG